MQSICDSLPYGPNHPLGERWGRGGYRRRRARFSGVCFAESQFRQGSVVASHPLLSAGTACATGTLTPNGDPWQRALQTPAVSPHGSSIEFDPETFHEHPDHAPFVHCQSR